MTGGRIFELLDDFDVSFIFGQYLIQRAVYGFVVTGRLEAVRAFVTMFAAFSRGSDLFEVGFVGDDDVVIFINHANAVGNAVNQRL